MLLLGLFFGTWSMGAAALTQTASPTSCTNQNNSGNDWSNAGNAFDNDNSYATSAADDGEHTDYLKCTGYGFSLPSDAIVEGITVSVARGASHGNLEDYAMRLVKGGVVQTTDRSTNTAYPTMSWLLGWYGDTVEDHGGSSDLWGDTWTAAQINASDFGAAFAAHKSSNGGGNRTIFVDHIEITVTYSQPSNVVINTYYPGSGSVAAGATSISLGTATGASTPIAAGDLVLIMQMQDATIAYTNDSAYGDGASGDPGSGSTNLGNSGLFEYAVATSSVPLSGGTLTLGCGTINSYATAAATASRGQRRFQVIRVPVYGNHSLTSVSALTWNGSTGGVLAFDVTGNLNLNSQTISVSGKGFRGGAGRGSTTGSGSYTDYRTAVANMANGSKGEGIAGTPRYVYSTAYSDTGVDGYPSGSFARGAPGNGGGGGTDRNPSANDQNSGGGGGGNGGSGGTGGIGWCGSFTTTAPYYGCGYSALASAVNPGGGTGGFGGSAVSGLGATRLTLGGGGGAATTNNSTGDLGALSSSGAPGGGVIMIRAATMSGSATFNANGSNGDNTVGNDGSGGGGAGGAVLISAGSGMGGVTINVRGGTGGSNLVPAEGYTSDPHGPGGGGGGGYALTSGATASCTASGGANGVTYRAGAYFGAYGALAGSGGACATTLTSAAIPGATLGGAVPCPSSLDHFNIDIGTGSASTCTPQEIDISARDSSNNVLTGYTGTVSLSTSSTHGNWLSSDGVNANPDPPSGTLTNGTADDGAASYTFVAGDQGTVTLYLDNHHADDLTVTVNDASEGVSTTSGTLSFRDNAFVITPVTCTGTSCVAPASGSTEIVAGRDHTFNITLKRRTALNVDCATATAYAASNVGLKFWISRDTDDPSGTAPTVESASLPNAVPAANNVTTLDFVAGEATFVLATTDVGKYTIGVRDDTSGFARQVGGSARAISGASSTLTVRPFALGFSAIQKGALANPGGTASGGDAFVVADDTFSATVGGYRWHTDDDSNNDGLPNTDAVVTDNGLTPAFAWATSLGLSASSSDYTPNGAGAILGSLTAAPMPPAVAATDYAGGQGSNATLKYSEVGSIRLTADVSDYLNTAGVAVSGKSGVVGRFYPDRFDASATLTPACNGAGTAFSYMGQSWAMMKYDVTARNRSGSPTTNYDVGRGYTKSGMAAPSLVAENAGDGVALTTRLSGTPDTPAVWAGGEFHYTNSTNFLFNRLTTGPDGPYESLQLGVSASDSDGTQLSVRDMNAATAADCTADGTCNAFALGTVRVRYGRARMLNANGSELLDLSVPFTTQYYAGTSSGFVANSNDTCSGTVSLTRQDPNTGDTLDASEVCAWDGGNDSGIGCGATAVGRDFTEPLDATSPGNFNLWLRAPGAGSTGSMNLVSTVPNWLQYNWDGVDQGGDGNLYDDSPSALASFGIYRGSPRHIYLRELY